MRRSLVFGVAAVLFVLTQCVAMADLPTQPVKWSQLPDMVGGLDFSSETKVPSVVADDWLCQDGLPVTDVHWWGSYWSTGVPTPPNGTTNSDGFVNAPFGGIQQFVLKFWADVPKSTNVPFSHPGDLLATVSTDVFNETHFGTTAAGAEVFQYNVYLNPNQRFLQDQGHIYWLSIEAVLPDVNKQWGWHESKDHWNDDACQQFKGAPWTELINNVYSNDMAFELTTVPEPGSMAALAVGLIGLAGWATRRRRFV